jgi:hypothetical protein
MVNTVLLDPRAVLTAALPSLGFTLSTDADTLWRSFYDQTRRRVKRPPTRGELRAVVEAWIAKTRAALDAHETKCRHEGF